jgi:hypothetical protein
MIRSDTTVSQAHPPLLKNAFIIWASHCSTASHLTTGLPIDPLVLADRRIKGGFVCIAHRRAICNPGIPEYSPLSSCCTPHRGIRLRYVAICLGECTLGLDAYSPQLVEQLAGLELVPVVPAELQTWFARSVRRSSSHVSHSQVFHFLAQT